MSKPKKVKKEKGEEYYDMYCRDCGGCGYIGCCGIRSFLKHHVEGKTNCPNEHAFIQEIVEFVEDNETFQLNYPDGDSTKLKRDYTIISYENKDGEMVETGRKNIGTKKKTKKKLKKK